MSPIFTVSFQVVRWQRRGIVLFFAACYTLRYTRHRPFLIFASSLDVVFLLRQLAHSHKMPHGISPPLQSPPFFSPSSGPAVRQRPAPLIPSQRYSSISPHLAPRLPRPSPQLSPRRQRNETLLAAMMQHSAPRAVLHTRPFLLLTSILEHFVLAISLLLLTLLLTLHTTHISRTGCSAALSLPPTVSLLTLYTPRHPPHRFAPERGLLLLSTTFLEDHSIPTVTQTLSPTSPCLGPLPVRLFLTHYGYTTILANALSTHTPGFLQSSNHLTRLSLRTPSAPWTRRLARLGSLLTALFILCTTATLVSYTLTEVQTRIAKLSADLSSAMRRPSPAYGMTLLRYAIDALVFVPIVAGILFFLFEFFDDQPLAFAVLVVAWLAEIATAGSTRHAVSRVYLPRLFFLYFGGFHFYFFSFPLGFAWLAFGTAVAFMFHACLAVWNRFEMPLMR